MSMCVLGMAEEFKKQNVAINALWPQTTIATSAMNLFGGDEILKRSRKPQIVADAAYWILTQPSEGCTGNFFVDETILRESGISDFDAYAVVSGNQLFKDFFLD